MHRDARRKVLVLYFLSTWTYIVVSLAYKNADWRVQADSTHAVFDVELEDELHNTRWRSNAKVVLYRRA